MKVKENFDWENMGEEVAFKISNNTYLQASITSNGIEYGVYGRSMTFIDGGVYDNEDTEIMTIKEAVDDIADSWKFDSIKNKTAIPLNVEEFKEKIEAVEVVESNLIKATRDIENSVHSLAGNDMMLSDLKEIVHKAEINGSLHSEHTYDEVCKIYDVSREVFLKYDDVKFDDIANFLVEGINEEQFSCYDLREFTRSEILEAVNWDDKESLKDIVNQRNEERPSVLKALKKAKEKVSAKASVNKEERIKLNNER